MLMNTGLKLFGHQYAQGNKENAQAHAGYRIDQRRVEGAFV